MGMAKRKLAATKRAGKPTLNKTLKKPAFKSAAPSLSVPQKKDKKMLQQPQQLQQRNQQPVIPFSVYDKILLVGEGDLSFTASLVLDHGASDVTATCFDSEEQVLAKYPSSAPANIASVNEAFASDSHEPTATGTIEKDQDERVLFDIDATKLDKHKILRRIGPFTRIIFNFPHTGGLSTEINRQVRHNQALLASFFTTCQFLLAPTSPNDVLDPSGDAIPDPSILVTLFEGEPYTLWNIRDLARSAGLSVERSFRFPAEVYPSYRHARTAGMIRKGGEEGEEESESAWKGEKRAARMYEFRVKSEDLQVKKKKVKRRGGEESSSEDDIK